MDILREETPKYFTLMLRKTFSTKLVETGIFIVLIIFLALNMEYENPNFKVFAVLFALLTLGISPIIYKIVVRPKYTLTKTELIIQKFETEKVIPLVKLKTEYDLNFLYRIDGKKTPLSVSNEFLDELEKQILVNKAK